MARKCLASKTFFLWTAISSYAHTCCKTGKIGAKIISPSLSDIWLVIDAYTSIHGAKKNCNYKRNHIHTGGAEPVWQLLLDSTAWESWLVHVVWSQKTMLLSLSHAQTHTELIRHQIKGKVYSLAPLCDLELDITELFLVVVIEMSPLRSALAGVQRVRVWFVSRQCSERGREGVHVGAVWNRNHQVCYADTWLRPSSAGECMCFPVHLDRRMQLMSKSKRTTLSYSKHYRNASFHWNEMRSCQFWVWLAGYHIPHQPTLSFL